MVKFTEWAQNIIPKTIALWHALSFEPKVNESSQKQNISCPVLYPLLPPKQVMNQNPSSSRKMIGTKSTLLQVQSEHLQSSYLEHSHSTRVCPIPKTVQTWTEASLSFLLTFFPTNHTMLFSHTSLQHLCFMEPNHKENKKSDWSLGSVDLHSEGSWNTQLQLNKLISHSPVGCYYRSAFCDFYKGGRTTRHR